MMDLPDIITSAILEIIGMPRLSWKTARNYVARLNSLRADMKRLSNDFAFSIPNESTYSPAYFAYNFPFNFMKVKYVMHQILTLYPVLSMQPTLRVLDIGCGEGAALMGILYCLGKQDHAVYYGYDASRVMVKQARSLIRTITRQHPLPRVCIEQKNLSDGLLPTKTQYDIIILSNALIEISTDTPSAFRYIERISRRLSEHGILIVIEPALISASHRIMELRDRIAAKAKLTILAPCLHRQPCPLLLLRREKEWCHQSIPWKPPEYVHIINQGLNREINLLKFSYLVISRHAYEPRHGYAVISALLREKGKKRCYLCSPQGRIELARLDKQRSPSNIDYDHIRKGDIIAVEMAEQKGLNYLQATKETRIRILSPARLS